MNKLNEKFQKSINGITLVSLIITIVIMLILAGVTINLIIGKNGLFTKSITATESYKLSNMKELAQRIEAEWNLEKENNSLNTEEKSFINFLNEKVPNEIDKVIDNKDNTYTIVKNEYQAIIDENENIIQVSIYDSTVNVIWDGTIAEGFSEGDGTEENPYLIKNPSELAYITKSLKNGTSYEGKYFKLNNSINLNNIDFEPIGNVNYEFKGNFDGNNKTISNLYVRQNGKNINMGLFGITVNASIKDLKLKDGSILGYSNIGSLAGIATNTTITNCVNDGVQIIGKSDCIGGLVGAFTASNGKGILSKCYNLGNVSYDTKASDSSIGGICGKIMNNYDSNLQHTGFGSTACLISDTYNKGQINGNGCLYIGGLVGSILSDNCDKFNTINIINSCNLGEIINGQIMGGCIGYMVTLQGYSYTTIYNLYNPIDVSGLTTTGGVIGKINIGSSVLSSTVYFLTNIYSKTEPVGLTTTPKKASVTNSNVYTDTQLKSDDFVNKLNEATQGRSDIELQWIKDSSSGYPILRFE